MILKDDYSEKVLYDYSDYPIYIRRSLLSSYPGYTAPSHWHDDIEFILILSGKMQYNVNGETLLLHEGEGVLVNARQMHFGFSDFKEECDFICILLHPMLLCITPAYERDFVQPLINHPALPFIHLRPDTPWQQTVCAQIQSIYQIREKPTSPMKIQAAFMAVWTLLYENMPPTVKRAGRQSEDLVILKKMIGFIQQNYMHKLSLSDIAAAGVVGQSKCCKLFSRFLGQTPNSYLTQYRLKQSISLLRSTDQTITEIAIGAGFGNGSYYAETFRKWIGKTPSEYRSEHSRALPLDKTVLPDLSHLAQKETAASV